MPRALLIAMALPFTVAAQTPDCAAPSNQELIVYRAGSLNSAFQALEAAFTCQTGIRVKDTAMGSVDAARQITAGGKACDLYVPADYLDIDLFLKPAGYADFNIVFARDSMVLAYSAKGLAAKRLPPIAEAGKVSPKWHEILTMPGVAIGAGNPFLDPGAYRAPMIFQLAAAFYKVPNLYNNLLEHLVTPSPDALATGLGKQFDFQFIYEHYARAAAAADPDYRYVDLPEEINLSDPARNSYYRHHAVVALPGLGTPGSARTVAVPGAYVAWGITLLKQAPNRANAIKFLQLLLGPAGAAVLHDKGPAAISPPQVAPADFRRLPASLRPLVATSGK